MQSNLYIDCKRITLDSKGLLLATSHLYRSLLNITSFEAVGGLTMGADPITGAMLTLSTKLKGFLVRKEPKEHGSRNLIEGPITPGMTCAILEDVATTGKSALKAVQAAQDFGLKVVAVGAIVDRQEGAAELFASMNIPFVALVKLEDISG